MPQVPVQFDAYRERHVSDGEAVKNHGADTYHRAVDRLEGCRIQKSSASQEFVQASCSIELSERKIDELELVTLPIEGIEICKPNGTTRWYWLATAFAEAARQWARTCVLSQNFRDA